MPARFEKNIYSINNFVKLALATIAFTSLAVKAEAEQINTHQISHNQLGSLAINHADLLNYSLPVQVSLFSLVIKPEVVTALTSTGAIKAHLRQKLATQPLVSPTMYQEWNRVHECEEPEVYDNGKLVSGGWHVEGDISSGGLGILNTNWIRYGGTHFAPRGNLATPKEQMVIASRIQPNPPDQNGCSPGGW